jgi:hypothetical protein
MATTIDSTWLTGKTAPYMLSTDNEIYTLATNVNITTPGFAGEVFILTGKNVQLKLNGYTVKVNGHNQRQITDNAIDRSVSEFAVRARSTSVVKHLGGIIETGITEAPLVPASATYKLGLPWGQV